jgi:hypothetical protein
MKKIPLFILFVFFSFQNISYTQSSVIQTVLDRTNLDSLMFFVEELSGEVPTIIGGSPQTIVSRHKYQPGNDLAADYIKQKLEGYGLTAYDQWFSGTGRNVYAVQTGTTYPNKKYIICAHYDDMPSGSTAPGADDNASGTAAVLEAARILSQFLAEYTIVYALWDEEEQGLVGSYYYAQQAYANGDSIMGVVNMDMIAWDSNNSSIADLHTRSVGTSLALKDKMVEVNNLYNLGLTLDIKNPGSTYSDHASFWQFNYGAILLIEDGSDFNNYYHTVNDLIIHFNQPYFLKMSKTSIGTIAALAEVTGEIPVELASFTGLKTDFGIKLDWITASEVNNNGFEIQRSLNGNEYITVGFVKGKGTTTELSYYTFTDQFYFQNESVVYYRLKQIDYDGSFSYSNIVSVEKPSTMDFVLAQNYPNPFNPSTVIEFTIPDDRFVDLRVYDVMGSEVTSLVSERMSAGTHNVIFNALNVPSGVYFYTLTAGDFVSTKKMMLVR